jgi:hypothetical protein
LFGPFLPFKSGLCAANFSAEPATFSSSEPPSVSLSVISSLVMRGNLPIVAAIGSASASV